MHVAAGIVQGRIGLHAGLGGVAIDHGAGIGVQAQVQPAGRHHANAVSRRVEVHPECRARERQRGGSAAHRAQHAARNVQRVQAPGQRQGIQHPLGHAEIDAHQAVARSQASDGPALQNTLRLAGVEHQKLMAGRDRHQALMPLCGIGLGAGGAGGQAQQNQRAQGSVQKAGWIRPGHGKPLGKL